MKTIIIFPDTDNLNGLGHFHRCYKYNFHLKKKFKVFFLINNNFSDIYLKKKKINYYKYKNLADLKSYLIKFDRPYLFLDSYNSKIKKFFSKSNLFKKKIFILDFKSQFKCDYVIDHTFLRKKNFHDIKAINYFIGHSFFPSINFGKRKKKKFILLDFGSVKNQRLINQCLNKINEFEELKKYKILIINRFYNRKKKKAFTINNKIEILNYTHNINKIYLNTYFSLGACGISLYEKCYLKIPSFVKSFASNQNYNYKNFTKKKCIEDLNNFFKLNTYSDFKKKIALLNDRLNQNFDLKKNQINLKIFVNKISQD